MEGLYVVLRGDTRSHEPPPPPAFRVVRSGVTIYVLNCQGHAKEISVLHSKKGGGVQATLNQCFSSLGQRFPVLDRME
jgi:hypothetical protein